MERSTETKILERQKQETQQIEDLTNGRGFSSDKTLARFFDCTRKTIWTWEIIECEKCGHKPEC